MAARPTLAEIAAAIPEDVDDELTEVAGLAEALRQGLARMEEVLHQQLSGEQALVLLGCEEDRARH